MSGTILIVDDETNLRATLAEILEARRYRVLQAGGGAEALRLLATLTPDLIFCDWKMPDIGGETVLRYVRTQERLRDIPLIVITAYATSDNAISAVGSGAYDFVTKPFDLDEIVLTAERALEHLRLHREVARLRARAGGAEGAGGAGPGGAGPGGGASGLAGMIGSTRPMLEVFKLIGRVAATDSTVLIRGESGTGKELVASAIHEYSGRDGPFVAVNCAALPDTLLESELFGHERGAFTGAVARKPGRFELAAHGTLFLDEIGDVSPAVQAKLLRVLQEHSFERLGGTETVAVDVRLVAATNRDLEAAVRDKSFREDLYYRLNVVAVTLPPLRERRGDIVALAEHFLQRAARQGGVKPAGLTGEAVLTLQHYDYPGNVRELENLIERAVVLAGGRAITPDQLAIGVRGATSPGAVPVPLALALLALPLRDAVAAVERAVIAHALEQSRGNKAEAARRLGIHRRLLYTKLAELGLQ